MGRTLEIIIVNYNSTDSLKKNLNSVFRNNGEDENVGVWVWDNNSCDNPGMIKNLFPQVHFKESNRNIGFAAAVNKGLEWSSAPYVMLLNPDTVIKKKDIDALLAYMKCQKDIGALGPEILNDDGSLQQSARTFPNWMTGVFGRTSILTRIFPGNTISKRNLLANNGNRKTPIEVDWVSGACMLVRRNAVVEVGFLDERFFMYWEDADWCRRMRGKGWRVIYYPKASVVHSVGHSSRSRCIRSSLEFHQSAYRLFAKYAEGYEAVFKPFVFGLLAMRFYIHSIWHIVKGCIFGGHRLRNKNRCNSTNP